MFNKGNEYGVTGLNINSVLPDKKILKIENIKEQEKTSEEIKEFIKQNKEPNLTFTISNPQTKAIEIPLVKKNDSELPKKKLTFFNITTKKNKDFSFYDYIGHLEKFEFEWSKSGFKYEISLNSDSKKIIKKLTLERKYRTFIQTDESRIWNMLPNWNTNLPQTSRISFLSGYLSDENVVKKYFKITGKSYDFTTLTPF